MNRPAEFHFRFLSCRNEARVSDGVFGNDTYQFERLKVFVDQASFSYLDGAEVDYIETREGSGFKFNNPNDSCLAPSKK